MSRRSITLDEKPARRRSVRLDTYQPTILDIDAVAFWARLSDGAPNDRWNPALKKAQAFKKRGKSCEIRWWHSKHRKDENGNPLLEVVAT